MTTQNLSATESIDVATEDLITALIGELMDEVLESAEGYRFVLVGPGKHKMAELHRESVARQHDGHDMAVVSFIDFGTETVADQVTVTNDGQVADVNVV